MPRELLALARPRRSRLAGWSSSRIAGAEVAATKSSPTDIVTAVDIASEELIRARLLGARPDDGFLGEEGDDIATTSGVSLDRRPDRRHGQLPLLPSPTSRSRSPPRSTERWLRRRTQPDKRRDLHRSQGRAAPGSTASRSQSPRSPSCRRPWSAPASTTVPTSARHQAAEFSRMLPPSATSGGWDRLPSTSASSPADGSMRTSNAASSPGIWPRPN